jgi:hypothetical protein
MAHILSWTPKITYDDPYRVLIKDFEMPPKTVAGLLLCRIVIMCGFGIAGIVALSMYGPHGADQPTVTSIVGFLALIIGQMLNFAKTQENAYMSEERSNKISNKLDAISDTTIKAAEKAESAAQKANVAVVNAVSAANKTVEVLQNFSGQSSK